MVLERLVKDMDEKVNHGSAYSNIVGQKGSLATLLEEPRGFIDEDEARLLIDLLRRALAYNPLERPSAAKIARHPWFSYQKD